MANAADRALGICRSIVRDIHPSLAFVADGRYQILAFGSVKLAKGRRGEWLRLEPEEDVLKVSARLSSTKEVEQWPDPKKLDPPSFTQLKYDLKGADHNRLRVSGTDAPFEAHRDFVSNLFVKCFEYALQEDPSISAVARSGRKVRSTTSRTEGTETIPLIQPQQKVLNADALRQLGSLDDIRETKVRREQSLPRNWLLRGRNVGACAICGNTYPVGLLAVAQIKRRADCTDSERSDPANVVPMCKFGCDDLFERGYIGVRQGRVIAIPGNPTTVAVDRRVKELSTRNCAQWTVANAEYFEWHYTHAGSGAQRAARSR